VEILTVRDAAEMLRCSPSTILRMIQRGELPAVKMAKEYRIKREAIEKLMEGGES